MKKLIKEKGDMRMYAVTGMTSFSCQCYHDCGCGDDFEPKPFEFFMIEKDDSKKFRFDTRDDAEKMWKKLDKYLFRNLTDIQLTHHEKKIIKDRYTLTKHLFVNEALIIHVSHKGNIVIQKIDSQTGAMLGHEENYGQFLDFKFEETVYEGKEKYWKKADGSRVEVNDLTRDYMINIIKRIVKLPFRWMGTNLEMYTDESLRKEVIRIIEAREHQERRAGGVSRNLVDKRGNFYDWDEMDQFEPQEW